MVSSLFTGTGRGIGTGTGQGCNNAGEGSALKPLAKILRHSFLQHATLERGNEPFEPSVCV